MINISLRKVDWGKYANLRTSTNQVRLLPRHMDQPEAISSHSVLCRYLSDYRQSVRSFLDYGAIVCPDD